jgi:hypothetical protein
MRESLLAAIQEVRDDLSTIDERIKQIGGELTAAKSQKGMLERALKTLLRLDKSEEGVGSSAATKGAVRPLVQTLLADNGPMSSKDLYDLVREKLAERSVSANGLGLRMKEVLGEPWVDQTAPGVFAKRGDQVAL